ncbi:MAG: NosD domain-containing protein [Candidatus Bathyarchaeota archaeon]
MVKILQFYMVILALMYFANLPLHVSAQERNVGVRVGDWFRYEDIEVAWDSDYVFPSNVAILQLNYTSFWEITCDNVLGTNITFHEKIHYENDTESTVLGWLDIDSGDGELSSEPWGTNYPGALFISANLSEGNTLYTEVFDVKINTTRPMECYGAVRQSNIVNTSSYSNDYLKNEIMVWDQLTGILCELSVSYSLENKTIGGYTVRLSQTNLWKPFRVHNLNTGLKYARIQEAINANETLDGHTIFVEDGTYYENVTINKALTIVGENKTSTIIDGNEDGNIISVNQSSNVCVKNFTIKRSGASLSSNSGIQIFNSSKCSITDNIFRDTYFAISLHNSPNITISNNVITHNVEGIRLEKGIGNTVSNNTITHNSFGISLHFSQKTKIMNNLITNNHYGIICYSSTNNTLLRNKIYSNEYNGLQFLNSQHNLILENTITQNQLGIDLFQSNNNLIYHNNFNNTNQAKSNQSNMWDNGVEGNYWFDHLGRDEDHNGISDDWHTIDKNDVDQFPLKGIFTSFNTSLGNRVNIISNSSIEDFQYCEVNQTIILYIQNMMENQTFGFCRICVPHAIMNASNITVEIDDGMIPVLHQNYSLFDNCTHRWIYFAYQHSQHKIVLVPEIPYLPILLVLILTITVIIFKRKSIEEFV